MTNIFGFFLKIVSFLAVLAMICLAIGVEVYAFIEIYQVLAKIFTGFSKDDEVIKSCLKALDLVLVGVIFFTVALALFELYVAKINNLPKWLVVNDLDDLKALLIKMVIFVMTISFTGRIVTYSTGVDILYLGIGLAVVIASLTYFLVNKKDT